jgi:SWI/SNF-related matrix-associated actin-dependent regulator of chromatin subfamily A protein 2/4
VDYSDSLTDKQFMRAIEDGNLDELEEEFKSIGKSEKKKGRKVSLIASHILVYSLD